MSINAKKVLKLYTQTLKGNRKHSILPATSITLGGRFAYSDSEPLYPEKEFSSFLKALQKAKTLTELTIQTDFLTHLQQQEEQQQQEARDQNGGTWVASMSYLARFLDAVQSLDTLESLEIRSCSRFHIDILAEYHSNNDNRNIFQHIMPGKLKVLKIDDLQVSATHKETIIKGIATAIEDHPTITDIVLHNFFANDYSNRQNFVLDPIIYMASTVPNLRKLEITGCGSHPLTGYQVSLVSPHSLSNLLKKRSNTLHTLVLSFLEFEKEQFNAIANQLRQNKFNQLHVLHLNYHHLCKVSFEQFMNALSYAHVTIQDLELRSLHFVADECINTNQGYTQALRMLQRHNYNIRSLSVNTATKLQQEQLDLYLRLNIAGRKELRNPTMTLADWIPILEKNSHDVDVTRHLLQELPALHHHATTNVAVSADGDEVERKNNPVTPAA